MKVRVRDIAARAGVSPATVSNALNGRPGVSEQNVRAILRLADEMGYSTQRASKTNEKNFVRLVVMKRHGLVVMDTQFFMELIEAIERECQREGHELVITHLHTQTDHDCKERIRGICAEECAGILLLGTELFAEEILMFENCVSPLVVLDNLCRHEKLTAVVMNNYEAGYQATYSLHEAGHRRIAHISSNVEFSNMRYRRKGYEAAMEECGMKVDESQIWRVTPTLEGSYMDMCEILAKNPRIPTAFFAGNDIIAVGCMRAFAEYGLVVPRDISLIGMDDIAICQVCQPPLSTINVRRQELGISAVRTLLHLSGLNDCHLKIELSVSVVNRQSVTVPRTQEPIVARVST